MSRVTEINIHFTTNSGVERVATIRPTPEPGRDLKRMFLDRGGPFAGPMPQAFTLDGDGKLADNDGPQVCYLLDTGMVCW
jgi:hypothetical protein